MRPLSEIMANPRVKVLDSAPDGFAASVRTPLSCVLRLVVSNGGGWEHASVSTESPHYCPSWEQMDFVARLVWREDEVPVQMHVGGSAKVDLHHGCLHLWRQDGKNPALPPKVFV